MNSIQAHSMRVQSIRIRYGLSISAAVAQSASYAVSRAKNLADRSGVRAAMTLLETTIVMIIAVASLAAGAGYYADYLNNMANAVAAKQLKDVSMAFSKYLQDNYATVLSTVPAVNGGSAKVAVGLLMPDYLSSKFALTNPYGQSYILAVRLPDATKTNMEAIVYTTGGQQIDAKNALSIAQYVGAGGGFTLKGGDPNTVQSTFNGYTLSLTDYNANLGTGGYLVSVLFMNETGKIVQDYLYRNTIPGRPELNRMTTALDMGANNLTNAGNITSPTGSIAAPGGEVAGSRLTSTTTIAAGSNITAAGIIEGAALVSDTTITATGNITTGGTVSAATLWTSGNVQASSVTATGTITSGGNMTAGGVVQGSLVNSTGEITSTGGVTANANIKSKSLVEGNQLKSDSTLIMAVGQAVVGSGCVTGTIALDATGLMLSCVNGLWKSPGVSTAVFGNNLNWPNNTTVVNETHDLNAEAGYATNAFFYCSLAVQGNDSAFGTCQVWASSGRWYLHAQKVSGAGLMCQAVCLTQ